MRARLVVVPWAIARLRLLGQPKALIRTVYCVGVVQEDYFISLRRLTMLERRMDALNERHEEVEDDEKFACVEADAAGAASAALDTTDGGQSVREAPPSMEGVVSI